MHFLCGDRIREAIKTVVARPGKLSVAVAYWGEGGANHTGIADRSDPENIRVICDLRSGACNPLEIRQLQCHNVHVRELLGLHAKVWISSDTVIVGSANASTGGLGDGADHEANIEAAVMVRGEGFARELQGWFDRLWDQEASPIDDDAMDAARWVRKHRYPHSGSAGKEPEFVASDSTDNLNLRQRLIEQVVDTAVRIDRSGDFSADITDRAIRECAQDPLWKLGYNTYLGSDPSRHHKQKERINTQFTRKVAPAVGAETRPPSLPSQTGGILRVYTPLSKL